MTYFSWNSKYIVYLMKASTNSASQTMICSSAVYLLMLKLLHIGTPSLQDTYQYYQHSFRASTYL